MTLMVLHFCLLPFLYLKQEVALHTTKHCAMNITKLAGCNEVRHIYCSNVVDQRQMSVDLALKTNILATEKTSKYCVNGPEAFHNELLLYS